MKKVSKTQLIKILKNKSNLTYNELSKITGYHPKSLIRINSLIIQKKYNNQNSILQIEEIKKQYLKNNFKTYKDFYYNDSFKFNISYSNLCKILNNIKENIELVIIKKIKNKGNYYFEIIDYKNTTILFKIISYKNDTKSIKNILYTLLNKFGVPKNITFNNCYPSKKIIYLLNKYHINYIAFKSIYRTSKNKINKKNNINYEQKNIEKTDFYNSKTITTISKNTIQFNNTRFLINTKKMIKKRVKVKIFFNNEKNDLFIQYYKSFFPITPIKILTSKKGNSKYN